MMKPAFTFFTLAIMLVMTGCLKDKSCSPKSVSSEEPAMQTYATANSINATRHTTGIYYEVVNPGSGAVPTLSSTVSVRYVGKLLNGTIFDSQNGAAVTFPLNAVIAGWQIGIPLIAKGGTIRLIIPSSLAYGCTGYAAIPPDAILYFEVNLVDVQ